jgi:hypothetical protein
LYPCSDEEIRNRITYGAPASRIIFLVEVKKQKGMKSSINLALFVE